MKSLMTTLFLVTLMIPVFGQECSYRKDPKDEFTGDQLKMTEWQTVVNHVGLMQNIALHFSLLKINSEEFVEVKYELRKDKAESMAFKRGHSKLFFKLANDEVIELEYAGNESRTSADRDYKVSKGGGSTKWLYDLTCKFALSGEQKAKLANSKVVKVRMILDKETVELDIPEKLKGSLLGFSCMGMKPKKFAPQEYFMHAVHCL